jgi:hypothetical protein
MLRQTILARVMESIPVSVHDGTREAGAHAEPGVVAWSAGY